MDPPFLELRNDGVAVASTLPGVAAVLDAWRAGKSLRTLQAYADDLGDFARSCALSPEDAVARLFAADRGLAVSVQPPELAHDDIFIDDGSRRLYVRHPIPTTYDGSTA